MAYYTAIKNNKVLIYARNWMNLKNIKLSEREQTTIHTVWFHSHVGQEQAKLISVDKTQNIAYL